jgi:hypothetical protein
LQRNYAVSATRRASADLEKKFIGQKSRDTFALICKEMMLSQRQEVLQLN